MRERDKGEKEVNIEILGRYVLNISIFIQRKKERKRVREKERETERESQREREGDRERESQRERERASQRERDRASESQRNRETERQRDRARQRETERETERERRCKIKRYCETICISILMYVYNNMNKRNINSLLFNIHVCNAKM